MPTNTETVRRSARVSKPVSTTGGATSAAAQRWTPRRIRAATAFPKPEGAIDKALDFTMGGRTPQPTQLEIALLRHIARHGDLIDKPVPIAEDVTVPGRWLLVPLPAAMLDLLAEFEAEVEDLEAGEDDEPDHDGEADHDEEALDNEDDGARGYRPPGRLHGPVTVHRDMTGWRKL